MEQGEILEYVLNANSICNLNVQLSLLRCVSKSGPDLWRLNCNKALSYSVQGATAMSHLECPYLRFRNNVITFIYDVVASKGNFAKVNFVVI